MTTEIKDKITPHALAQFTGTEKYYKHWTQRLVYTDGVSYLVHNGASWIVDLIASYQTAVLQEEVPFQCWKFKPEIIHKNDSSYDGVIATMTDGNYNEFRRQEIEYTDLPCEVEVWYKAKSFPLDYHEELEQCKNWVGVAYLISEH